ncbi:MAG: PEP-CTERM sorting domain-containing protein, partial [Anaerolineae bacterium]
MGKVRSAILLGLLLWLGSVNGASALTVDLLWSGTGTPLTRATGSETVSLEVWFSYSAPPPTVMALSVSLSWDPDELSLVSCNLINKTPGNLSGEATWQPITGGQADCPTPSAGLQPGMNQEAAWTPHTVGDTVQIGTLVFHQALAWRFNHVVTPFMSINDGWADGNWYPVHFNAVFNDATVMIPEPATAILVGAGFLGLLAAGRRRR